MSVEFRRNEHFKNVLAEVPRVLPCTGERREATSCIIGMNDGDK